MIQEQRELLLKDLCARLPYGVKVEITHWRNRDKGMIDSKIFRFPLDINKASVLIKPTSDIRPYLFPLSSMTEEQYNEFFVYFHDVEMKEIETSGDYLKAAYLGENAKRDWLNKNHFDYHYLIEKGLAIDATNESIY